MPENPIDRFFTQASLIYLHKFLPLIVSPLGLVCLLFLISLWQRQIKWIALALVFLLIFSLPLTSFLIWKSLEALEKLRSRASLQTR